jgi:hypothetical protein
MPIAEPGPLIAMTLQALMNRSVLDNQGIDPIAIVHFTLVRRPVVALGAPQGCCRRHNRCDNALRVDLSFMRQHQPNGSDEQAAGRQIRRPRPLVTDLLSNRSLVDMAVDVTHGPLYHRRVC